MGCLQLLGTVVGCRGLPLAVGNYQELLSAVKGCHGLLRIVLGSRGMSRAIESYH